jgi:UDP-N-acetylmuramyl pentapeptide phosphotransferase/UDP-N-acetylglucosamine-1-phosphate transferase
MKYIINEKKYDLIFKEYLLSDFLSKEKNIFFIISFFLLFILGTLDDKFSISANRKLIISFIIISTFLYLDNHSVLKEIRFSFLDKIIYLKDYSFFLHCYVFYYLLMLLTCLTESTFNQVCMR